MAHSIAIAVEAVEGQEIKLPLEEITGQTLVDFSEVTVINDDVYVADPATALGLTLTEVDSVNAPGFYMVAVTPSKPGTLHIHMVRATFTFDYTLYVKAAEPVSDPSLEGEFTITVNDGADPVQGAVVRIFNAGGTLLVTRGTTNAAGELKVSLPVGTYEYRVYKDGFDATSVNPTVFTVQPNDDISPLLEEVVPGSASIGDTIMLLGSFFHSSSTEVEFGTEATVAADFVSSDLKALLVTIPAGLTGTIIPLRVVKDDPANPPSGKLYSNTLTLIRT